MIPLAKNIKRYFSFKELAIVLLAVVLSVSVGVAVFLNLKKEVVINDDGNQIAVKTMKTTVREVLEQNGITLRDIDYINLSLDSKLQKMKKNEINIKRAFPVYVQVDGQEVTLMTYKDTVKETLDEGKIVLNEKDRLEGAALEDSVQKEMKLKIVRVTEQEYAENLSVPFNVVRKENTHMDMGKENVLVQGNEGVREKKFKITFEDGMEVARQLISDAIIANPIDKIIEFGTVLNHKTARGDIVRYKNVLDMRATAYTASYKDTGKGPGDPGFGITASGMAVRKGIIAVDPRVIPLGTKVYVEVAGDTPDYGFAVAADTGGAIKGDLIDLYYDEQGYVDRWGVKRVKVYILNDQ